VVTVPLGELGQKLSRLRLCRPASEEHMRRSLERHGQLSAVTAFDEGGRLQLVDGFKRLRASQSLGWEALQVHRVAIDEATATAIIGALHEQRGLTELEEGWIVRALHRDHGLSQGAVAHLLRRHKSWVSRRLLLVEGLDPALQGDVRLGLLSARSAIALAALPRGNQLRAAEVVTARGMTTRQVETLVRRLRELDSDEARDAFLSALPAGIAPSARTEAQPRSEREQLHADIAILMRVGVRLEVRLLEMPVALDSSPLVHDALSALDALLATLRRALGRAAQMQDKLDATVADT